MESQHCFEIPLMDNLGMQSLDDRRDKVPSRWPFGSPDSNLVLDLGPFYPSSSNKSTVHSRNNHTPTVTITVLAFPSHNHPALIAIYSLAFITRFAIASPRYSSLSQPPVNQCTIFFYLLSVLLALDCVFSTTSFTYPYHNQ